MEILGLIPARLGSVRIPGKNTIDLGGKPLIQWTMEFAIRSQLNRTIVCTDDPVILDLASKCNLEFLHQPKPFSDGTEHASKLCLWLLDVLLKKENYSPDGIFLLLPTSPFRTTRDIDKAIDIFKYIDCESVIGVKNSKPIECLRYIMDGYLIPYVSYHKLNVQSQDTDETFMVNGAVFLIKPDALRKYKSFHIPQSTPYWMCGINSIDIDTIDDLNLARDLLPL